MEVELTKISGVVFDKITHPFFIKFNELIRLQNELGQINATIVFNCDQYS